MEFMFVPAHTGETATAPADALVRMTLQEFAAFLAVSRDYAGADSRASLKAAVEGALNRDAAR